MNKISPIDRPSMMNVRIESDGTAYGTKVIDNVTGKVLNNVASISIQLEANKNITEESIKMILVPFVISGGAEVMYICGHCKEKIAEANEKET